MANTVKGTKAANKVELVLSVWAV